MFYIIQFKRDELPNKYYDFSYRHWRGNKQHQFLCFAYNIYNTLTLMLKAFIKYLQIISLKNISVSFLF